MSEEETVAVSAPAEPVVDLEAVRDARVVPVAQGVLEDIASEAAIANIENQSDISGVMSKILIRTLEADLNLTTENTYVFQLVLGAYGALSSVIQNSKMREIDEARFARIGSQVLGILAKANVPMGTKVKSEDQVAALEALKPELEAVWAAEDLSWLEIKYVLEGVFRGLKTVENNFSVNVEMSLKRMEAKILGVADMSDVTMKKLDETLRAEITPQAND